MTEPSKICGECGAETVSVYASVNRRCPNRSRHAELERERLNSRNSFDKLLDGLFDGLSALLKRLPWFWAAVAILIVSSIAFVTGLVLVSITEGTVHNVGRWVGSKWFIILLLFYITAILINGGPADDT